ncbi:hypothetical protein [Nocardioides sp.]|uniref:hypothetical protein n=1 Tax=Nocardioides sp. TaxID=35761 RepID=UPI002BD5F0D7|nr:hypothetical protein [Nocardioides sp.]HXH78688.1 hypothetical protein [Nocardioides sp.]
MARVQVMTTEVQVRRTSREAMSAAQTSPASEGWGSVGSIKAFDVLVALAGTVVTFVWAAGVLPAASESGRASGVEAFWVSASLIGLVAGSALHTPIHELGHVLAAAAVRLPVVSVRVWNLRFGRPDLALVGTSGHVTVELADALRGLPVRMILFSLGGSAAVVTVALATASTVIANPSAPTGLRALAVGFTVAGFCDAVTNLTPRRLSRDQESDGRTVLRWIVRPTAARADVYVRSRPVPQHPLPTLLSGTKTEQHRRAHLLSEIGNKHPDVAIAAITELFRRRPRWDDGWQDYDAVATFAARDDLPSDVRAKVSSQYCLSLALAYLVMLRTDEATDPESTKVRLMDELAELALAAKRGSLQARTAMALVRIIQMRPAEARALLGDVESSASPTVQARARAVLGIAEIRLGNLDQARALAAQSRRIAPTDSVVKLLHTLLAPTAPG